MSVMDISNIPQKTIVPLNETTLRSKFSLKFQNAKYEKDYQDVVLSDIASTLGINHREKCKTFILTYFLVTLLYNSAYLSTYLNSRSSLSNFLFQAMILTALSILALILFFKFLIKGYASPYKGLFLLSTYTLTVLSIIFSVSFSSALIFSDSSSCDFSSILGVLPLIYTSKFTVFNSFVKFFWTNLFTSLTFLLINLVSNASTQRTLIEFFFLLSSILLETLNFYNQEILIRQKFVAVNNLIIPEKKVEDTSPKTDLEEIMKILKESIQLIPNLTNKEKAVFSAEKLFDRLTKVVSLLGNRNSVYSLDLEGLEKNLDNEDKIFIEETCIQPRRSFARSSSKFLIRKTIDVLKNYEMQELVGLLKRVGKEWNFDMFFLADCTQDKALFNVGSFCIQRFHLDTNFLISESVYEEFFKALEGLYKPNPYHNSTHAADVLASFLFIVNQSSLCQFIQDYEILAVIVAMLGHDVGHPGLTNRFLVNSKHSLSVTCNGYLDNDSSVLENMHCATTFTITQDENKNIFRTLPKELYSVIRSLIIEMILSTDMAKHFDLVGKFKARLNCSEFNLKDSEHRAEILRIITKASDVGHAGKSIELHQKWTNLICEEFFTQGDLEKKLGLPVSMYCDREKTDLGKSQVGFIKNIVLPIYESLYLCFGSQQIKENCIEQLENNVKMWEDGMIRRRVMTLFADSTEFSSGKMRNETTVSGKVRNSIGSLLLND